MLRLFEDAKSTMSGTKIKVADDESGKETSEKRSADHVVEYVAYSTQKSDGDFVYDELYDII